MFKFLVVITLLLLPVFPKPPDIVLPDTTEEGTEAPTTPPKGE